MPNLGEPVIFTLPGDPQYGKRAGQERVAIVTAVHDDKSADLLVLAIKSDIAHPFEQNTAKFGPVSEGEGPNTFRRTVAVNANPARKAANG